MALQALRAKPTDSVFRLDTAMRIVASSAGHFSFALLEANRLLQSITVAGDLELIAGTILWSVVEIDNQGRKGLAWLIRENAASWLENTVAGEPGAGIEVALITKVLLQLLGSPPRLKDCVADHFERCTGGSEFDVVLTRPVAPFAIDSKR
jgi:hypothetical protein